jgi:hypothetical protein
LQPERRWAAPSPSRCSLRQRPTTSARRRPGLRPSGQVLGFERRPHHCWRTWGAAVLSHLGERVPFPAAARHWIGGIPGRAGRGPRRSSDTRTAEQAAIARKWVPFSGVVFNGTAAELIGKYHRSELEAARILAYANTAAFDAIIGCFDTKFAYWFLRPTQADPLITLAVGLPNHPSYPSAHSCETGAFQVILEVAFPAERAMLDALAQEANVSRVYGGIHYRIDGDAGLALGRAVARAALERGGIE